MLNFKYIIKKQTRRFRLICCVFLLFTNQQNFFNSKEIFTVNKNIMIDSINITRLRQVITNLLSNAEKFTNEGSITVLTKMVNKNTLRISMVY